MMDYFLARCTYSRWSKADEGGAKAMEAKAEATSVEAALPADGERRRSSARSRSSSSSSSSSKGKGGEEPPPYQ